MAKNAADVAAKWVQGMQSAGQAIADGVNAVTVAPGAAAARQVNAYVNGVTQNQQKWVRNVGAVSLADWRESMITKGAPRIGQGAVAAQGKMESAMAQLLPAIDGIVSGLPPRGDLGQNITRMTQFVTKMSQVQIRK